MHRGYTNRWRKIEDTAWYKKPLVSHLAQHLIGRANFKDKRIVFNGEPLLIERGQVLTGRKILSIETGLSEQNIRTSLNVLIKCQFLTSKTTNRFSIITILNYDIYQSQVGEPNQQSNQLLTSYQPATNQLLTTPNKDNKDNKDITILFDFWNEQKIMTHKDIEKHRDAIKKALKDYELDELKQAISNYKTVLDDSNAWWNTKNTLKTFLSRSTNLDRFLPCNFNYADYKPATTKSNNKIPDYVPEYTGEETKVTVYKE